MFNKETICNKNINLTSVSSYNVKAAQINSAFTFYRMSETIDGLKF